MIRRFNFTGRVKIESKRISVKLNKDRNGNIVSFDMEIDLSNKDLPNDARVYVEAYHKTEVKRFDFGTVGDIRKPIDTNLIDLAYAEDLRFRVLVVQESTGTDMLNKRHGLIIAHADGIKPKNEAGKKSILPANFTDIGQQVWVVDFSGYESAPCLVLNNKIPNIKDIAETDPMFFMFVYPNVIRQILFYMIYIDGFDQDKEWHKDWFNFAKSIVNNEQLPKTLNYNDESFDNDEVENWINIVVEEFCDKINKWNDFVNRLTGGGE